MTYLFLIPILSAGIFRFLRDARGTQFRLTTRLQGYLLWKAPPALGRWYVGGNSKYNPSLGGDFWHFTDGAVSVAWTIAAIACILWPDPWVQVPGVILGRIVLQEFTFTLLRHSWNPIPPDSDFRPFWVQVGLLFTPWRNPFR